MFDIHAVTGFYSAVCLFCLSATGVVSAYDSSIFPWMYCITDTKPNARFMPSIPRDDSTPIAPERALEIAKATMPQALPVALIVPIVPKGSYNIRMHFAEDRTSGGKSWVIVDRYSGEVLVTQK
jgi:uncharacterized iron-regulated membrane protein